jgi:hypothetical protein
MHIEQITILRRNDVRAAAWLAFGCRVVGLPEVPSPLDRGEAGRGSSDAGGHGKEEQGQGRVKGEGDGQGRAVTRACMYVCSDRWRLLE